MAEPTQKIHLRITPSTSPPHTISLSQPDPHSPLTLHATLTQTSSPHPERAITLLTKYTALDTTPTEDAFTLQRLKSPTSTTDPSRIIRMSPPPSKHVRRIRVSGSPDLRERGDGFEFVSVPGVDCGEAVVNWDLSPASLFRCMLGANADAGARIKVIEERLREYEPGEEFEIKMDGAWLSWWTWGSLTEGSELEGKKFSRWCLPWDGREGLQGEDLARKLTDPVDLHDVNFLHSRSAVEGEESSDVEKMRKEGWLFGEGEEGLVVTEEDEGARFVFIE